MPDKNEFVKLWISYEAYFEPLSDVEVGRLARAMIKYKSTGAEPKFNGNERFIWPAIKRDIDVSNEAQAAKSEQNRENVLKRWNKGKNEPIQTGTNHTGEYDRIRTDTNDTKEKEKEKGKGKKDTPPIAPQGEPDGFAAFWSAYPKKIAKQAALTAWKKLSPGQALTTTILQAVERQKGFSQWTRENGRYIPNPETWLNQGRWEDEDTNKEDKHGATGEPSFAGAAAGSRRFKSALDDVD